MALRALVFLASQALMSKLGKLALFFEAMFNIQCFVCEKREEKNESLQAEFRALEAFGGQATSVHSWNADAEKLHGRSGSVFIVA